MLRNRMIRAAIPKGSPISFVDATGQVVDVAGTTGTITVSTGDFIVAFSHGKIADEISFYSFGGTSTVGTLNNFATQGTTIGDGGNDYLNIASSAPISSGGTLNMSESGGRDAGFGLIAFDGGDSISYSAGTSGSISVSGVTANDAIIIYETTQQLSTSVGTLPGTPSGYTSAFSHQWQVGQGGSKQGWSTRVSYQTGLSGTVSHTIPSGAWDYIGSLIIRVYS
jgi:hypothetical protein